MSKYVTIKPLTQQLENRIIRNPLLNIDTFIIPSPFILDKNLKKDYDHSFVWQEEGEIMGYILIYSNIKKAVFHIYKVVTSPFGRGKGVGTFLIEHLTQLIPKKSQLYLFIWEKQPDTIDFFEKKGFVQGEPLVYRNLVYIHLSAKQEDVKVDCREDRTEQQTTIEEIGKTRHDARKTLRLLSSMVDMLSVDNGERIIEDINRETTSLINTLNSYRNSMTLVHKVNIKDLINGRIIPYVEASPINCEFHLILKVKQTLVLGSHVAIGRALLNLVSNALDAIEETKRDGIITVLIEGEGEKIILTISDNGSGIDPCKLILNEKGVPAFVGESTKTGERGEGVGTTQIFSTFDASNINVVSKLEEGTTWTITLDKFSMVQDRWFVQMERRYNELDILMDDLQFDSSTERPIVITYIWQMRKMEIFLFDLISQLSKYNNIRDIYRTFLSYRMGAITQDVLIESMKTWRTDYAILSEWILTMADEVKRRRDYLEKSVNADLFRGALFKSWGQSFKNVIIFTLNPEARRFLATDRKLAEHLDFAPYLNADREDLLRGEFIGDTNSIAQPLFLGVWQINDEEDLIKKLKLIRKGAAALVAIGINPQKKLSLYQTTYVRHSRDINTDLSSTLKAFADLSDQELMKFSRESDDEMNGFIMMQD